MPRTLPWLKGNDADNVKDDPGRANQPRQSAQSDRQRYGFSKLAGKSRTSRQRSRTPSTSPPPPPPTQEFMRQDAGDDTWVMVEDEFLAVAQSFTRHLHHAEYKRLKKLASQRSAETIGNIPRPVEARSNMSAELQVQKKQEKKQQQIAAGMDDLDEGVSGNEQEDEEDEEELMIRDRGLASLMQGTTGGQNSEKKRLVSFGDNCNAYERIESESKRYKPSYKTQKRERNPEREFTITRKGEEIKSPQKEKMLSNSAARNETSGKQKFQPFMDETLSSDSGKPGNYPNSTHYSKRSVSPQEATPNEGLKASFLSKGLKSPAFSRKHFKGKLAKQEEKKEKIQTEEIPYFLC